MTDRECGCPYCNGSLDPGVCSPCGVNIVLCPDCGATLPPDATVCAACGAVYPREAVDKE